MKRKSLILALFLVAQCQIIMASPQAEIDEKHDYRHAPSMEAGKKLYVAGICTIIAGGVANVFLQRISSTNLFGTNASTYFAPYNYPLILGGSLLALGTKKMADYVSTSKGNKFRSNPVAFPLYLAATALDITGMIMLITQSPNGKTALYFPVELSSRTVPGAIVSTAGSALHLVTTIQYLIEKKKIMDEVAVRITPSLLIPRPKSRNSALVLRWGCNPARGRVYVSCGFENYNRVACFDPGSKLIGLFFIRSWFTRMSLKTSA